MLPVGQQERIIALHETESMMETLRDEERELAKKG